MISAAVALGPNPPICNLHLPVGEGVFCYSLLQARAEMAPPTEISGSAGPTKEIPKMPLLSMKFTPSQNYGCHKILSGNFAKIGPS